MPTLSSHCLTALAVNSGPLLLPLYIWEHHAGQTSHSNAVVHFRYWDPFPHQWPGTHVYTHLLIWVYVRFGHHVFLFVQNHSSKRGFCRPALTEYSCHHSATIFFFWVVCSVPEALLVAKDVQFASGSHPSLPVISRINRGWSSGTRGRRRGVLRDCPRIRHARRSDTLSRPRVSRTYCTAGLRLAGLRSFPRQPL